MRPTRLLTLLIALALVVAACGGSSGSTSTTAGSGGTTTTGAQGTTTTAGAPSGDPIVVGGTLSLTGGFGATGIIHKLAGEMFVERLNANGGLLGRPVVWDVRDDESVTDNVATLYEQLISQEGVDLIIGPYATPNIQAAMPIAERYGFVLPQHTAVLAPTLNYACQFPAWSIGYSPNEFIPNQLIDALESVGGIETVAVVTNQSGSVSFVSYGRPDVDEPAALEIFPERGIEVVADIPYPPGNTEWDAIATQIRSADPDLVMLNGLGVDANGLIEAMLALDGYLPPAMFALFPAPGPLLGLAAEHDFPILSVTMFEPNDKVLEGLSPEAAEIAEEFARRAADAGIPYTTFETQAAASWNAWEILAQGVQGAGSLDHQEICDWLHANGADLTFVGHVDFDPAKNNFWDTNQMLKQVQDGDWVVVWPADKAAAALRGPSR
ncbi:MAG: ABC transporter substrate-binding protein [Actinomycetes bacterium]|jgi:branched-chain amino acid transport system substrate-binding protein|nr:MAG: ABC transporter substrate-binding protein [Actinomycetota bacterium]